MQMHCLLLVACLLLTYQSAPYLIKQINEFISPLISTKDIVTTEDEPKALTGWIMTTANDLIKIELQ